MVNNLSSTKASASRRKSMQVNASGWPNETQVERKSKTLDLIVYRSALFSLRASKLETETRNYILRFYNREEVYLTDFCQFCQQPS